MELKEFKTQLEELEKQMDSLRSETRELRKKFGSLEPFKIAEQEKLISELELQIEEGWRAYNLMLQAENGSLPEENILAELQEITDRL